MSINTAAIQDRTTILIRGQEFDICPEKCIYHRLSNCLFIADLHFGKTNHFRKAGIPLPSQSVFDEFDRFNQLIQKYQPNGVVFLGDLFHSNHNASVDLLKQIIDNEVDRRFHLVMGNHDILRKDVYKALNIELSDQFTLGQIIFTHEPMESTGVNEYNIYGHIHPGIVLKGKGRQSLRLPCFYFDENKGILPAYGIFTGLFSLTELPSSDIFVVAEDRVMKVQSRD